MMLRKSKAFCSARLTCSGFGVGLGVEWWPEEPRAGVAGLGRLAGPLRWQAPGAGPSGLPVFGRDRLL